MSELIFPEILRPDFKGFWLNSVTDDVYHADKTAVSSTSVRLALRSPRAFYQGFVLGQGKADTPAMRLGRIAHMALLEPDRFKRTFVVMPKFIGYTKDGRESEQSGEAREKRAAWLSDLAPGAQVMTQEERDKLMFMIDSLLSHDVAVNLIKDSVFEQSGYFRDPVTGLKCRIRPDILRKDLSAFPDLKTSRDAGRDFFSREIWNRGYHVQLGFYGHGIEQIHGRKPELPCFIVVENQAPYDVCVYACDDGMMDRGMTAVRKGLDRIKECVDSKLWPGLQPTGAEPISLPTWSDWLEE